MAGGAPIARAGVASDDAELAAFPLSDLHCHLGFAGNSAALANLALRDGMRALSVTVTPDEYEKARMELASAAVRIGLGLHPWWVADGRCGESALERFEELLSQTRYVGEIGLDFSARFEHARDVQVVAFRRALAGCADKVVSLHAVRSAGEVLDELERLRASAQNRCIFHWFSGSSDDLTRAVSAGCYFSLGSRMLSTRRGRAYARAIPSNRLLLETDYPCDSIAVASYDAWWRALEEALLLLAAAREENVYHLAECVQENAVGLLQ